MNDFKECQSCNSKTQFLFEGRCIDCYYDYYGNNPLEITEKPFEYLKKKKQREHGQAEHGVSGSSNKEVKILGIDLYRLTFWGLFALIVLIVLNFLFGLILKILALV